MLSLKEIKKFYPESLHQNGEFLIREFLQYKLLEIIYESKYGNSLVFLGGTCLRLIHGNTRFSEDLDFDNKGLDKNEFSAVSYMVKKSLELEGYETDINVVHKGAFHCYVRFPGLLFSEGLSGHKEQKILIQLDTEPQNYDYAPEKILINKFDVFTEILTTPLPVLLAQKFYAVLNRKRNKGRDFFDISFLLGMHTEPDWKYLEQKIGIYNKVGLKKAVLEHCEKLDMREMAKDVEPFLFQAKDIRRVALFTQLVDQIY
ncbi:MAG: nucleotidyl transferase AbiEii/AbiGii toxin family protein [Cytophagaceae bacterium]|nr:nucleotidyl transferase AbiEii/AbiGii toxin family protein [Cytophagaceae bacterium]